MTGEITTAPTGWYGYATGHGLCGVTLNGDSVCTRKVGHGAVPVGLPLNHTPVRDEDPVIHRAFDPSGSGDYVDFDDDGNALKRYRRPHEPTPAPEPTYTEADVRQAFYGGWVLRNFDLNDETPEARVRAFDIYLALPKGD